MQGRLAEVSLAGPVPGDGAWLDGDTIVSRWGGAPETVAATGDLRMRGRHNVANAVMAVATARAMGLPPEAIADALRRFPGLPHRLQVVGRARGAIWIDDSIATSPERTVAALEAVSEPAILLLGGREKALPLEKLRAAAGERCHAAICFGEAATPFAEAMAGTVETVARVETLTEAVEARRRHRPRGRRRPALAGGHELRRLPPLRGARRGLRRTRGRARWIRGGVAIAVTSNRRWPARGPDYTLLALIAVLTITGLVTVYSASFVIGLAQFSDSHHFIARQALWAVLGGALLIAAMRLDYHILRRLAVPLMGLTLVLLLFTLIVGTEAGGAQRWLTFGGFSLQPAEFTKLSVIVYLAAWLNSRGDNLRRFEQGLMPFIIIISAIGLLLMLQPDLGTTGIIITITITMFWAAGATLLQMSALFVSGSIAVVSLTLIEGYRFDRLSAFLSAESDPLGNGFQTLQALIALGNGGPTGLGLGASRGKFFYVPESHTDGIFAILGEELGLVATGAVVLLFVTLMLKGYQVARRAPDQFGFLLATGITTWIAAQAFVNIGGITRVIPLTGVPLPFISYGGSALAAVLLAAGVLASISRFTEEREAARERTRTGTGTGTDKQSSERRDEG